MQFVENWEAFAGGWALFLDEAECCLWRTLFLDGGKVPIIEVGYRLWGSWTPFLDGVEIPIIEVRCRLWRS
jgi:hypothetical protein